MLSSAAVKKTDLAVWPNHHPKALVLALVTLASGHAIGSGTVTFKPRDSATSYELTASNLSWSVTRNAQGKAAAGEISWTSPIDPAATTALYRNALGTRQLTPLSYSQTTPDNNAPRYTLSASSTLVSGLSQSQNELKVSTFSDGNSYTLSVTPPSPATQGPAASVTWDSARQVISSATLPGASAIDSSQLNRTFANGSFSTYIRLGNNRGFSTDLGYENWTVIDNFALDLTVLFASVPGTGGLAPNPPAASPFRWTQQIDSSTVFSLDQLVRGSVLPEVVIEVVANGDGVRNTVRQIVLQNASVNSIALSDNQVAESLSFLAFRETLWSVDASRPGQRTPVVFEYDFARRMPSTTLGATRSPVNFGSGNLTQAASLAVNQASVVPEPASIALALPALLVLLRRVRIGQRCPR